MTSLILPEEFLQHWETKGNGFEMTTFPYDQSCWLVLEKGISTLIAYRSSTLEEPEQFRLPWNVFVSWKEWQRLMKIAAFY